ncbi:MAG: hypothetical protein C4532_14030 [Candidatus Abyssobacteria bacterium SURF_17]|jgi:hypothetical protein|uniref:Uncharacterized protein n=1 Tax=Candidatus Abyssobacteria bacterium SURF_17 TaxID=2093361 RepID=A0A419EUG9_9BACT|nr:MAG: hypothetical protein C4532_14030 [Candidatus Abyssubacteria bacterium SURF_17]
MRLRTVTSAASVKIAAYYLVWLALAPIVCLLCIGMDPVLAHASRSKPYAVVFRKHPGKNLPKYENAVRIISFGDSNYLLPADDTDPSRSKVYLAESIQDLLDAHNARPELGFIEWPFVGAAMFDYYCLYFEALKYSPQLIVVPVNWRWFGDYWRKEAVWFYPELAALVPQRNKSSSDHHDPLASRGISRVRQLEYKAYYYGLIPMGIKSWLVENAQSFFKLSPDGNASLKAQKVRELTLQLISEWGQEEISPKSTEKFTSDAAGVAATFPMIITDSNPTFRDLVAFVETVSEGKTQVLFYIWPMDKEYLANLGIWDQAAFDRSRERIIRATSGHNIRLVDLSGALEHEHFNDWLGHCTVEGRKKIGQALAPEIIAILKKSRAL